MTTRKFSETGCLVRVIVVLLLLTGIGFGLDYFWIVPKEVGIYLIIAPLGGVIAIMISSVISGIVESGTNNLRLDVKQSIDEIQRELRSINSKLSDISSKLDAIK